jgi:hypothetical protein
MLGLSASSLSLSEASTSRSPRSCASEESAPGLVLSSYTLFCNDEPEAAR